jgi:predicted transcriptional regulator
VNDERCQVGLRLSPELKARLDAAADVLLRIANDPA